MTRSLAVDYVQTARRNAIDASVSQLRIYARRLTDEDVQRRFQGVGDLEGVDGHHVASTPQCRMTVHSRAERTGQSAVSPGKHAGAAVRRRGRARAREGEEGGAGGAQEHRSPCPWTQDMFCTSPGTPPHPLMRLGEGTESPAHPFHVNGGGTPPSSAA